MIEAGWHGCLIEGDPAKYAILEKMNAGIEGVTTVNSYVGIEGPTRLDNILEKAGAPAELDFMSIDVDGIDWHIWNSLTSYRPRVVCIETSLCIPYFIDFVQKPEVDGHPISASPLAIYRLGRSKGYYPVAYCGHDWIFVREDLFEPFGIAKQSYLELYREGIEYVSHLPLPTDGGELDMKRYVTDMLSSLFQANAHHFDCVVNPAELTDLI
ncbi:MAG: hypothetical protein K5880_14265 [Hydrogenophaga sp.]|uniref:hypothetical protein n=1 Tax=Hydrogenophaga sp. TaxID=1904254 RepID=UPI0026092E12|nr:hypothetical protein [Hydrogenophaga sp.]MCV0439788.1 hypothetical protein [Hydrogenophaga sp.]